MTRPTLPFDLPTDHLRVTLWADPLVEAMGHDVRSAYVERFWLALLGPSTTLLARHLAAGLDDQPEGFDLDLDDTAKALGLGLRAGVNGPFLRALARSSQFGITKPAGPGAIAVRVRLQTLTQQQVRRLPPGLQDDHARWLADVQATPDVHERRQRARRLALSLLELGESPEAAEHQLHRWKVHPALAHEALRWAAGRRGELLVTAADAAAASPSAPTQAVDPTSPPPIPPPPPPRRTYAPDDAA